MREIIYLSEHKLNRMLLGGMNRPKVSLGASVTLPFGVSFQASNGDNIASDSTNSQEVNDRQLDKAVERLVSHHSPSHFPDPSLRPHRWFHFDLEMGYGTAHEDSGLIPDDVALFGGTVPSDSESDQRPVSLLLCGSLKHLRTHTESAGRMGSGTDWLHDIIIELERREQDGIDVIPEFLTEVVPTNLDTRSLEGVAHGVFGVIRSHHPKIQRGRLTGYARTLMNIDSSDWTERLVVATPLYVEIPPQRTQKHFWKRRR